MAPARNARPKTAKTAAARAARRVVLAIAFPSSSRQEAENAGQNQKGAKKGVESRIPNSLQDVTRLLEAWGDGDDRALQRLIPIVHAELHRIASHFMAGERMDHSLQATALVNEAYIRLLDVEHVSWQNRAHFLAMAARLMRRILVDAARSKRNQKRGGEAMRVTFDEGMAIASEDGHDVVAINDALDALARVDERKSRVIELRFFGGLTVEETAVVLRVSPDTVTRDWRLAKTMLLRELRRSDSHV